MNNAAPIGHNGGPELDPMLAIQEAYDDTFAEVANWLDGNPVTNAEQLTAVDSLLASIKEAQAEAAAAKEAEYRPHKAAGDAVIARWKSFLDDLDRQRKGLVAAVDTFKRKLAAEKEAARQEAERKAWAATRAAEEAARKASATDIEAQREAAAAQAQAEEAQRMAAAAKNDTVKGLRTVTRYEITDHRALLHFIAANHKADLTAFIEEWARKHHKEHQGAPGLHVWTEKAAF